MATPTTMCVRYCTIWILRTDAARVRPDLDAQVRERKTNAVPHVTIWVSGFGKEIAGERPVFFPPLHIQAQVRRFGLPLVLPYRAHQFVPLPLLVGMPAPTFFPYVLPFKRHDCAKSTFLSSWLPTQYSRIGRGNPLAFVAPTRALNAS
jgi:hypothetical protein